MLDGNNVHDGLCEVPMDSLCLHVPGRSANGSDFGEYYLAGARRRLYRLPVLLDGARDGIYGRVWRDRAPHERGSQHVLVLPVVYRHGECFWELSAQYGLFLYWQHLHRD